jgi:glycosyltransferase involved in cell wall biosynthesis
MTVTPLRADIPSSADPSALSGRLSVAIPLYNEEATVPLLLSRLRPVLDAMLQSRAILSYEVIFVDDSSSDRTVDRLEEECADWPQVRILPLRRHCGQQLALAAGLDATRGEWVITMDGDLQDPPELIPEMLAAAVQRSVDVVYTCHADRSFDGRIQVALATVYYRLLRRIAGVPVQPHVGDFRLITRPVLESLKALPERHRVHRLLLPWLGFPSVTLHHRRDPRAAGRSHYSLFRLLALTMDSVVSFTTAPLRWVTFLGLGVGLLSVMLAAGSVIAKLAGLPRVPGWASLAVAVTFLGGLQLICTGVLGEYVGRTFAEVQRRPLYEVATELAPGRSSLRTAFDRTADSGP